MKDEFVITFLSGVLFGIAYTHLAGLYRELRQQKLEVEAAARGRMCKEMAEAEYAEKMASWLKAIDKDVEEGKMP